ncbi:MAG: PfkB family carbohydrate kinase [Thermodesulfobacteriota bacterium]
MPESHEADPGYVVGLGQASMDFLGQAPEYPAADSKCELTGLTIQGGGPAATAMVTLSRLGRRAAIIGAVGDDDSGRFIRDGLIKEKVDVSRLTIVPGGRSQTAFIVISPPARRAIFWHPGLGTDLSPETLDLEFIRQARLLHVDGLKLAASLLAARTARQAGRPVTYDAGTLRPGCLDLVASSDYLICSEKFFSSFHQGPDIRAGLARLLDLGPRQAVVTLGSRGSHGFDGRDCLYQPAFPIAAVDTTGAGDVYHGAYIHGILSSWDMAACMRFASAAAALKCRRIGGRAGIPRLEEVRRLLGEASF